MADRGGFVNALFPILAEDEFDDVEDFFVGVELKILQLELVHDDDAVVLVVLFFVNKEDGVVVEAE